MSTQNPASNASDTAVSSDSNGKSEPTVVVDPSVLAEANAASTDAGAAPADGTSKVEKTEAMPIPPVAAGIPAGDTSAVPPAANVAGKDDEEDAQVPLNDGRTLKYGLGALAVLAVIGLFIVGYMALRNSAPAPTVVIPAAPAAATAAGGTTATLPEVRTPAPRLIDATGCRRGQYRVEGNQLVFTNCATLELSETAR